MNAEGERTLHVRPLARRVWKKLGLGPRESRNATPPVLRNFLTRDPERSPPHPRTHATLLPAGIPSELHPIGTRCSGVVNDLLGRKASRYGRLHVPV